MYHFKIGIDRKIWLLFISNINTLPKDGADRKDNLQPLVVRGREDMEDNEDWGICGNCYEKKRSSEMVKTSIAGVLEMYEEMKKYRGVEEKDKLKKDAKEKELKEKYGKLLKVQERYPTSFLLDDARPADAAAANAAQHDMFTRQLPNPIKLLFPQVRAEQYKTLKNSAITTTTFINICASCYVDLIKYHTASGQGIHKYLTLQRTKLKGTRSLYPNINLSNLIHKVFFW